MFLLFSYSVVILTTILDLLLHRITIRYLTTVALSLNNQNQERLRSQEGNQERNSDCICRLLYLLSVFICFRLNSSLHAYHYQLFSSVVRYIMYFAFSIVLRIMCRIDFYSNLDRMYFIFFPLLFKRDEIYFKSTYFCYFVQTVSPNSHLLLLLLLHLLNSVRIRL